MSSATNVAEVTELFYNITFSDSKSHRPYLRRNVLQSLCALTMGNQLSALKSLRGWVQPEEQLHLQDEDDDSSRAAKRRKLNGSNIATSAFSSVDSFDFDTRRSRSHVRNQSSRTSRNSSRLTQLQPSDFYGRSLSASNISSITSSASELQLVPPKPVKFQRALWISLDGIEAESEVDDNWLGQHDGDLPLDLECTCHVDIYASIKDGYGERMWRNKLNWLSRRTQPCKLRVSLEDGKIQREIFVTDGEPCLFMEKDFYTRNGSGRNISFGFADQYRIEITIINIDERVNSQSSWPPIDIPPASTFGEPTPVSQEIADGGLQKEDLLLACGFDVIKGAYQDTIWASLQISYGDKLPMQYIPYHLKVKAKWTLPSHHTLKDVGRRKTLLEKPIREEVAVEADSLIRQNEDENLQKSPGTLRTSSRRAGVPAPTYSDRQRFKELLGKPIKPPREGHRRVKGAGLDEHEISVEFHFGNQKQHFTFADFDCPFCQRTRNHSFEELRLHLLTDHSSYKFHVQRSKQPRYVFFVDSAGLGLVAAHRSSTNSSLSHDRLQTIQLGKSKNLLDLEKYLNGDESWAKGRHGPDHNMWPPHLRHVTANDSSLSSSPPGSRQSSPNTSNPADDGMDIDFEPKTLPVSRAQKRREPRKIFFVPEAVNGVSLHDTVTKEVLTVGEEVPLDSDDEVDETWLDHRQRDCVDSYMDVTDEEKEYLNKWNPFVTKRRLTPGVAMDKAIIDFADATKTWLTEKPSRKKQFLYHTELFILRSEVRESTLYTVIDILRAEDNRRKKGKGKEVPDVVMDEAPPRNRMACACGEFITFMTSVGNRIVCTGLDCPAPFYHWTCAEKQGRKITGESRMYWKCNKCLANSPS